MVENMVLMPYILDDLYSMGLMRPLLVGLNDD